MPLNISKCCSSKAPPNGEIVYRGCDLLLGLPFATLVKWQKITRKKVTVSQPTQKLKQQYSIYTDARVDIDKHSVFCSLLFSIYSIYIHIQITHVWIFINLDHPTLHHPTNPTKYGLLEQVLRPHHFRPHQNRLTRAPKKTPHWTALAQSP